MTDAGVVEAIVVRWGLQYARDLEVRDLEAECDAQVIIYVLLHLRRDLGYLGHVICNILELVEVFDRVTFV